MPGTNVVKLGIADHLSWVENFQEHIELLEKKVNAYLSYIESGQLRNTEQISVPASPRIHIVLYTAFEPSGEAKQFLSRLQTLLENMGFLFATEWRPADPDLQSDHA